MNKVNVLDEHISNLIAAGEVVLDPKSVIKELVENCLDANASVINIVIDEAGYNLISVEDDGVGMSASDAQVAIKRHATSKIKTQFDLNNINTLGFRGEALPSIASVSFFKLETCDGDSSILIEVEGGNVKNVDLSHVVRKGTKITVSNLFYNTPARLKHQVSSNYQFLQIKEYVYQMSLIHPTISFRLTHNNALVFSSYANDLLGNVGEIYGFEVAKNIVMVEHEDMDFKISGFFVDPKYSKSNKKAMLFSINKRLIWSNNIASSIVEALSSYLMVKKYPICYFDIELDTSLIDVNVHPQKRLVKISKEDKLTQILQKVISETMLKNFKVFETNVDSVKTTSDTNSLQTTLEEKYNYDKSKLKPQQIVSFHNESKASDVNIEFNSELEQTTFSSSDVVYESAMSRNVTTNSSRNNLEEITYIGQYLNSYLLGQIGTNLVLIDQHAAMERINYELYLQQLETNEKYVSTLVVPITIDVSEEEMMILEQNKDILHSLAISYEEFGNRQVLIREIPSYVTATKVEKFLNLVFDCVFNNKVLTKELLINEIAIIKACKLSLKANQAIDKYEANKLIDQLYYVQNYSSCPHGRPLIIKLSNYEVEKLFKRVV